ncbi:MAG TPA: hypothetical protein VMZ53_09810 [Kofleriaceae bacterium]|nr:hypothetical protein [Kofleriaceae bacterium]
MLKLLANLFGRRSSRFNRFGFGRQPLLTPRRGGIGLGTLAAVAAPYIIRKVMQRRALNAG